MNPWADAILAAIVAIAACASLSLVLALIG